MAWIVGDSFDFYTSTLDAGTLWDTVGGGWSLSASGRFTGSQALLMGLSVATPVYVTKASGSNDQTHHIVVSHRQSTVLGGAVIFFYFTLSDGATDQCTIAMRSDGTILLQAGGVGGATLATYSSAFVAGAWNGFEFEVKIDNSVGEFHVRKNGNTVDDFTATGLDTQASANAYANKLTVGGAGSNNSSVVAMDDLMWFSTSGAAPNTWVGDVRAVQLMPSSDVSIQFAPSPATFVASSAVATTTTARANGVASYLQFTAGETGTIGTATVSISVGGSGNLKAAIYDSTPSVVIGTASNVSVNPGSGIVTLTFGTPVPVVKGTVYYLALDQDFSITYNTAVASGTLGQTSATAYASFPAAAPVMTSVQTRPAVTVTITPYNSALVNEPQNNSLTDYVLDATVGHADFYNLDDLPFVPVNIYAVVSKGWVAKSDAGAKSAKIQLKSGGTTVQSATLVLATTFQYINTVYVTDPNTSTAWGAAGVNALQIGPYVQA